jgi:hypothetical protein
MDIVFPKSKSVGLRRSIKIRRTDQYNSRKIAYALLEFIGAERSKAVAEAVADIINVNED